VALSAIDTGSNTNITINGKGAGTILIGNVSTGAVTITPNVTHSGTTTLSGALIYGGVTLSNAVSGTGSMVLNASPTFTGSVALPAVTLGGTVSGGGNQINNVIIGASTPLAGTFTTLTANTSVSSPIHTAAGTLTFESNGTTFAGSINASQQWQIGTNTTIPASINLMVSNNTAAPTPLGFTPMVLIAGADSVSPRFAITSYNQFPSVNFLRANGTAASPTAVASGNTLANFFGHGYATSGGAGYVLSAGAGFQVTATDNYTSTVAGARFDFQATPTGSASVQTSVSVGAGLMVGTTSDPGTGGIMAKLPTSVAPAANGEFTIQATSNTSLTFKYKGSDGTIRTSSLTLA
jgi:hypothetical protein